MKTERTLSILKPGSVSKHVIGEIITKFENNKLYPIKMKMITLTRSMAKKFYFAHRNMPFYNDLSKYMSSGPIVVQVLEGIDAIKKNRLLMGKTNPKIAEPGTIRKDYGESIEANAIHGSDSEETAEREISFFFSNS